MNHSKGNKPKNRFEFNVSFAGQPDDELDVTAYAFDHRGRLLDSSGVKFDGEEGRFELEMAPEQAQHARLFLAPTPPKGRRGEAPTMASLQRLDAYEPLWRYEPDQRFYPLLPVPELHWHWWLWCMCRVRGQVVRPVVIQGETHLMPVCNARVHICEVDRLPRFILRLPEKELWRLRDDLLPYLEQPPIRWPRPLPDPPPFRYDPGVIDPSPENLAVMNQAVSLNVKAFDPQPDPPMPMQNTRMLAMRREDAPEQTAVSYQKFSGELQASLRSDSVQIVRQALADNYLVFLPYLCWIHWFWYWYRCDEVAVVMTDGYGRFDTTIWYRCLGDKPDLYFWVEYSIGGSWTTVYRRPIGCSTYWNYACGSEVTIQITDPRVGWCGPAPRVTGNQLMVLGIGENISTRQVETSGANAGLTKGNADPHGGSPGGTVPGAPFGGVLEPRVIFGDTLVGSGITHYRWSYRRLTNAQGTAVADTWHALDTEVVRHYSYTKPDGTLAVKPYLLGPDTDPALTVSGENLFQIQPDNPPQGHWTPQVNAHQNTASAFFQTHVLAGGDAQAAAGQYELKLELFDNAGSRIVFDDGVNPAVVEAVIPTANAPFGADEVFPTPAPAANRLVESGQVVGFRMVVRVDNNPCEGVLQPVEIGGVAAGPCGFLEYANAAQPLTIRFRARHENDFATFDFDINRGSSGTIEGVSGPVGVSIGSYAESNGDYVNTSVTVNDLVGSCPGGRAAFAEDLYVTALATNGWHRLHYLDANPAPIAFALAPEA